MNKVADALSRQPGTDEKLIHTITVLDNEEVCPWYRRRYESVKQNPEDNSKHCGRNGKLYRHFWELTDSVTSERQDPWVMHSKTSPSNHSS